MNWRKFREIRCNIVRYRYSVRCNICYSAKLVASNFCIVLYCVIFWDILISFPGSRFRSACLCLVSSTYLRQMSLNTANKSDFLTIFSLSNYSLWKFQHIFNLIYWSPSLYFIPTNLESMCALMALLYVH